MVANTAPIFSKAPRADWAPAAVSAANTAKDGTGDGIFTPSRRGEACEAWIAYISAWRP